MVDFITDLTNTASFGTNFGAVIEVEVGEHYEGVYIATPTESQQTFATQGKVMDEDFIVEPIPSNYGRVEWNGLYLKIV